MRVWVTLFLFACSCSKQPSESSPPHTTEAASPRSDVVTPAPTASAPSIASAASAPSVDAAAPALRASAAAAEEPAPNVKVISIGMHVAGGPYDEDTKKPFLKAVEPHYAELAKCWNKVADKTHGGDAGVDLLIPPQGGKAKVSHPRSTVDGEGFLPCVVAFFETIEFDKPKNGGLQGLSYSVRFKPGK